MIACARIAGFMFSLGADLEWACAGAAIAYGVGKISGR